jgi:hypothetical protein
LVVGEETQTLEKKYERAAIYRMREMIIEQSMAGQNWLIVLMQRLMPQRQRVVTAKTMIAAITDSGS